MSNEQEQINEIAKVVEGFDLADLASDVDSGGHERIFPALAQTVKNAAFSNDNEEVVESYNGKKTVTGVLLGLRVAVIGYPGGYVEGAEKQEDPVFGGATSLGDADMKQLIKEASAAAQFTPVAERDKFYTTNGGPGRAKPSLELLVWTPKEGIITLKSASHYVSVYKAGWALDGIRKVNRSLPIKFTGTMKLNRGRELPLLQCENVADEACAAFRDFLTNAGKDVAQDIADWNACKDNPLGDSDIEALEAVRALNPPRK